MTPLPQNKQKTNKNTEHTCVLFLKLALGLSSLVLVKFKKAATFPAWSPVQDLLSGTTPLVVALFQQWERFSFAEKHEEQPDRIKITCSVSSVRLGAAATQHNA